MDGQTYDLNDLRELTTSQYDAARNAAIQRIQKRIGDKPKRADFKRDFARTWNSLDVLALVIFFAALILSSVHILRYIGIQTANSINAVSQPMGLGIVIEDNTYSWLHQVAFIALAEAAMLLFFVMSRLSKGWFEWFITSSLATGAMVFVFVANIESGLNWFLSILAPAFTIGIGFRLETIIVEEMKRRQQIDRLYQDALAVWENANRDPTKHEDWQRTLRVEIWQKLVSYKSNAIFVDAPPDFRVLAVLRELEKEHWANGKWDRLVQQKSLTKSHETHETRETSPKTSQPRVKIHEVARKVRENGDEELSAAEMMERYSISMGSTTKIRQILSEQNGHSNNGHHDQ